MIYLIVGGVVYILFFLTVLSFMKSAKKADSLNALVYKKRGMK